MAHINEYVKKHLSERFIELIKYGFWGVVTTAFNLIIFYIMIQMGIYYIVTNVVSYFMAVILSYYLNNKYVFKQEKQQSGWVKLAKFSAVRVAAIVADSALLVFLVSYLKFNLMFSRIFLSLFIILVTYIFNKIFVFSSNEKGKQEK